MHNYCALLILIYNEYIIVVNKKSGLLTISNHNNKDNTLYGEIYDYLKKKHKNNKVFIVHRLDKDTSGLILFAKSEEVKYKLQDNWENVKRYYYAIVNGIITKEKDTLKSYLKETKTLLVYSSKDGKNGKLAITNYERIKYNDKYSLLKIDIKTGRKNQIRVQLSDCGYPIVGDKKYGFIKNKVNRLYLHAYYLEFIHPVTKELLKLECNYPMEFNKLIKI